MISGRSLLDALEGIKETEIKNYIDNSYGYFNKEKIKNSLLITYRFKVIEIKNGLAIVNPANQRIFTVDTRFEVDEDLAKKYLNEIKDNLNVLVEEELYGM